MSARTVCAAFQETVAEHPDRVALRTRDGETTLTWGGYDARVRHAAAALHGLGLRRGDTLALMLSNRPEFHVADAAAMHLGAIPFSIYNTSSPEQVEFVVRDSGARIAVVEAALPRARRHGARDRRRGARGAPHRRARLRRVLAGRPARGPADADLHLGHDRRPEGRQLSHRNMVFTIAAYDAVLHLPRGGRVISYLPMAHIAERNCSHYFPMELGFTVTCCPDPREVLSYFPEVRPTWFFAVPRLFEKLGRRSRRAREAAATCSALGMDELKALNVGAAPCPPEVIEFFHGLGLPLGELWGMSETTAIGACNPPAKIRIGTVGPAVPACRSGSPRTANPLRPVRLRGLPRPPRPHARDVHPRGLADDRRHRRARPGRLPPDRGPQEGADHQRGRQEHVARQHREPHQGGEPGDRLRRRDRRPPALQRRADRARARRRGARREAVPAAVEAANARLSGVEQIKRYTVLDTEWQPGGDELTPTSKLRRKPIEAKYAAEIEALYG